MTNFGKEIGSINKDYTSSYFAEYMQGEYGVTVGYAPVPLYIINMKKTLADWQLGSDCEKELCKLSKQQQVNILAYPKYGGSPFPQINGDNCEGPFFNPIQNVNIQNVQVITPALNIQQFTVGSANGPVTGTFIFTPLDIITGLPPLKNKSISLSLGRSGPLTIGEDYRFDITTGTITLLSISGIQLLFNLDEVYTIIIY